MDKPHKEVITTHPVAIKSGQPRVHVLSSLQWQAASEKVKCPMCETVYIMPIDFPKAQLVEALETQHRSREDHPDFISNQPGFLRVAECNCDW